jgi:hypothetical protein
MGTSDAKGTGQGGVLEQAVFASKFVDWNGSRFQKQRRGVVVLLCPRGKFDAA